MSNAVAMVPVDRVVAKIRRHVEVSDKLAHKVAHRKNISVDVAKEELLTAATKVALKYARGNEKKAGMALIITGGKINRLPQCAKLLRIYDSKVVRVAYEIKEDLSVSSASLRAICDLVESTDGDPEGESSRIQAVLDELATQAISKKHQFYFHRRLRDEVRAGRLIEAVCDEILEEIVRLEREKAVEAAARSEIYERELAK